LVCVCVLVRSRQQERIEVDMPLFHRWTDYSL
jgi:hypothetical protein